MSQTGDGKIGLWAVVAIGVGGMVGGGIFAVLGLAVQLAHGGTPVAFAVAGAVALLTAYSYAKLSVAYPSRGGTVTFLDRAFGPGRQRLLPCQTRDGTPALDSLLHAMSPPDSTVPR